jgi:hypothetical protein
MMQHAGDKNVWGKGIYFAEKAAYSNVDKYVFQEAGEGYRELLLAKVLVGEAADLGRTTALSAGRNSALKFPPKRDNSRMRYDTVKGVTTAPCQACLAAGIRVGRASLAGVPAALLAKGKGKVKGKVIAARAQAAAITVAAADCTSCTSTLVYIVYENGRAYPGYYVRYSVATGLDTSAAREEDAARGFVGMARARETAPAGSRTRRRVQPERRPKQSGRGGGRRRGARRPGRPSQATTQRTAVA